MKSRLHCSFAMLAAAFIVGAFTQLPAIAQDKGGLTVEKAWARATPPGAAVGGGYLTIRNPRGAGDRLVGAASPVAARTELHEMAMDKDVMRMREVKGIDVPPKGALELKPGGYHLMFIELKAPLKPGEKVPVTLKFENAGEMKVELAVEAAGAATAGHGGMKH